SRARHLLPQLLHHRHRRDHRHQRHPLHPTRDRPLSRTQPRHHCGSGMTGRAGAWRRWIVTLGGSGMSPVAPGTVGSLAATGLLALIILIFRRTQTPLTPITWNAILVAGIIFYGALCVMLGQWATEYYGRKDPGACVLDEGAGICLTAL